MPWDWLLRINFGEYRNIVKVIVLYFTGSDILTSWSEQVICLLLGGLTQSNTALHDAGQVSIFVSMEISIALRKAKLYTCVILTSAS